MARIIGCKMLNARAQICGTTALVRGCSSGAGGSLPSKDDVYEFLTSILLMILGPCPSSPPPTRVDQPLNLAAFIHLLNHLHSQVQLPAHWVADYLNMLLEDRLETRVTAFDQTLPIPVGSLRRRSEVYKVNLGPWRCDLRLAVSDLAPLLKFPRPLDPMVDLLLSLPQFVFAFKAKVIPTHASGNIRASAFVPVVALAFYRPYSFSQKSIASVLRNQSLVQILSYSEEQMKQFGQLQILLSQTHVRLLGAECEVGWRMGGDWKTRMLVEEWVMVAFSD
jgi:hypothetical protein